ncbi:MAG: protein kinase, partial [Nannocystaceae bacterium]|nr:protein kinase [Nannocystaceae bacterium]
MRPSSGNRICGQVQIDEDAAADLGGHAFGPTLHASLPSEAEGEAKVWLTVVERSLVPSQVDVSSFMARMGELLDSEQPGLVPIRLVDREADFCVVGYQVMPGAVPLQRRIEGAGSTAGLVARVAVEVARGLAHLHRKGRVHGALAPGNIVLWQGGVALWQHGLTLACSREAVAPRLRALGGDVVAPEVRAGNSPTATSDVYAWGAVIAALATDTVGSAALAAVEDGELAAGLLTDIIAGALAAEIEDRPMDGLAVLRLIAEAPGVQGSGGAAAARQAELRELAGRYIDEVEGKSSPRGAPAEKKKNDPSRRRQFRRTATELYPPDLAPVAGEMMAPDAPEPDPFTVSTDAVAPAEVLREEPEHVPTPAPMQITARRIEDEPNRRFNPDALTPPDGARLSDLEPPPLAAPASNGSVSPGGVSLPPLVGRPGGIDDGFTPGPGPLPTNPLSPDAQTPTPGPLPTPAPLLGPPGAATAPIPPPPQHDDMSAEDSGFGLSLPVAETLDSRDSDDEGFHEVVGALGTAESSPRLSTVDGAPAEANPALNEGAALELDLPSRPKQAGARTSAIGRLPPRAPAKSALPPKPEGDAGRGARAGSSAPTQAPTG